MMKSRKFPLQPGLWIFVFILSGCAINLSHDQFIPECCYHHVDKKSWRASERYIIASAPWPFTLCLGNTLAANHTVSIGNPQQRQHENWNEMHSQSATKAAGSQCRHNYADYHAWRECMCLRREPNRAEGTSFQWKHWTAFTPASPTIGCSWSSRTRIAESGKRSRRLQTRSWNVDSIPNPTGQVKRNRLRCLGPREDGRVHTPSVMRKLEVIERLLMSTRQRTGDPRSRKRSVLHEVVVSLAAVVMWILLRRDHARQKEAARLVNRLLHLLPTGFGKESGVSTKPTLPSVPFLPAKSSQIDIRRVSSSTKTCERGRHCENSGPLTPLYTTSNGLVHDGEDDDGGWYFHTHLSAPRVSAWVAPISRDFLPSVSSRGPECLDHVGFRLASLASLPASCSLSRIRLAEAGFHYNPSINRTAVVCHRCDAAFSIESSSTRSDVSNLLAFHRAASPQCPLLSSMLARYIEPPPSVSAQQLTDPTGGVQTQPVPGASSSSAAATLTEDGRELSEDGSARTNHVRTAPVVMTAQRDRLALTSSNVDIGIEPSATASMPGPVATSSSSSQATQVSGQEQTGGATSGLDGEQEDHPPLVLGQAVYPQYSTVESRLPTFRNWPLSHNFSPQALVALGFFFAGYADCIRCFFCGVGLKNWEPNDDALLEHVRWRPTCGFLLATKGRQFLRTVQDKINGANGQNIALSGTNSSAPAAPTASAAASAPLGQVNVSARETSSTSTTLSGNVPRTALQTDADDRLYVRRLLKTVGFCDEDINREMSGSEGRAPTFDRMVDILMSNIMARLQT